MSKVPLNKVYAHESAMKTPNDHSGSASGLQKWSIKPATTNKSARVRDNQRRHRERVRNYITQLELDLAESRDQLRAALSTIEDLRAQLAAANDKSEPESSTEYRQKRLQNAVSDSEAGRDTSIPCISEHPSPKDQLSNKADTLTSTCSESQGRRDDHVVGNCCDQPKTSANPLLTSTSVAELRNHHSEDSYKDQYCTMQPPGSASSTIACAEALRIVAENNHAGLDMGKIHEWLQPGYRRPSVTQKGCRVDNQLVFTLLDHITSALQ